MILSTRGLFVGGIGAQVLGEIALEKVRQEGIFRGIGKKRAVEYKGNGWFEDGGAIGSGVEERPL